MTTPAQFPVGLDDIREAARRGMGVVRHTPLLHSHSFSQLTGLDLYLKAENLQTTGAFKIRGAVNRLATLTPEEKVAGVIAASMGNHAQGVARAASYLGIACTIVMPLLAPLAKYQATRGYGADVVLYGDTLEESMLKARELQQASGATFIHAYDDWGVIAGQGTLGLEMLEDLPDAAAIAVPVGGGGLIAGIAIAVKALRPDVRLIGVQAAGCASYPPALAAGKPLVLPNASTIADGIRVRQPGERPLSVVSALVDEIVTVDDDAISETIVQLLERRKLVVEGAGAVGLAALLRGVPSLAPGTRVIALLCGGNIDVTLIGRMIDYGLTASGRLLVLRLTIPDTPGQLARVLQFVGALGVNLRSVTHERGELRVPVGLTSVVLQLETRDAAHQEQVIAHIAAQGYSVSRTTDSSLI